LYAEGRHSTECHLLAPTAFSTSPSSGSVVARPVKPMPRQTASSQRTHARRSSKRSYGVSGAHRGAEPIPKSFTD
jgi:hypothetical protein